MPTRGPQAGPIIFSYTGLLPMINAVQSVQDQIENVDMTAPVRGAGKVWDENFKAQGWLASRGWRPLSEFTRGIREWRGYNPDSPILEQSGGLRKAAAQYPMQMREGQKSMSRTTPATPFSNGTPTTIVIRMTRNRAILTITGSKVANNFGGEDTGTTWTGTGTYVLPQRRFWFVSPEVQSQMEQSINASVANILHKAKLV